MTENQKEQQDAPTSATQREEQGSTDQVSEHDDGKHRHTTGRRSSKHSESEQKGHGHVRQKHHRPQRHHHNSNLQEHTTTRHSQKREDENSKKMSEAVTSDHTQETTEKQESSQDHLGPSFSTGLSKTDAAAEFNEVSRCEGLQTPARIRIHLSFLVLLRNLSGSRVF